MSKPAIPFSRVTEDLLIYISLLFLLLITATNILNYTNPKKVLGISTQSSDVSSHTTELEFWTDFLNKNPSYIPGWKEMGNEGRANEIDPNY